MRRHDFKNKTKPVDNYYDLIKPSDGDVDMDDPDYYLTVAKESDHVAKLLREAKRELKDEYRIRAIERNSSSDFVEGFFSRWDEHISDCEKNTFAKKIVLSSGEFLSDVIDKIK